LSSDYKSDQQHQNQGHDEALESLVGAVLDDRYQLISVMAVGGAGVVYAAEHKLLRKTVAVKVLHATLAGDQRNLARFYREVAASKDLDHPNIVHLWASGVLEDGRPYLVMDKLAGPTLTDVLRQTSQLPWQRACSIFLQITAALSFAHERGIIHRDIKPGNIIFANQDLQDDLIQVVDFGLARILEDVNGAGKTKGDNAAGLECNSAGESELPTHAAPVVSQAITTTGGSVAGSPAYMSPEQCRSEPMDARSDVYSLGCLMYETLSGSPPFEGETALEIMYKQGHELPPSLFGKFGIPDALVSTILKALEKDPALRYQSMNELGEDIKRCLLGKPVSASASAGVRHRQWYRWSPRNYMRLAAAVAVGILLCGLAGSAYGLMSFADANPVTGMQLALAHLVGGEYESFALNECANDRMMNERYETAKLMYRHALELTRSLHAGDPQVLAQADLLVGDAAAKCKDDSEAGIYFTDGFNQVYPACKRESYQSRYAPPGYYYLLELLSDRLANTFDPARLEDAWKVVGDYAASKRHFSVAEAGFRKAIVYADQGVKDGSVKLEDKGADIEWVAEIQMDEERFKKAAQTFEEAYVLLLKSGTAGWDRFAHNRRMKGYCCYRSGDRERGLMLLEQSLVDASHLDPDPGYSCGNFSSEIGGYFEQIEDNVVAKKFYLKAYDYYAKSKEPDVPEKLRELKKKDAYLDGLIKHPS
jgi:serine/threonine protein kinase